MNVINPNKFADESLEKANAKMEVNKTQNGHQTHLHVYRPEKNLFKRLEN